jgi:hypothetical protein
MVTCRNDHLCIMVTCRNGHLLVSVTFLLSLCILLYILIRYSGHLFNVVSGHHLLVISSVKPLSRLPLYKGDRYDKFDCIAIKNNDLKGFEKYWTQVKHVFPDF